MNIKLTCVRKNENLDVNTKAYTAEIVFDPSQKEARALGSQAQFGTGAAIGTPNSPAADIQKAQQLQNEEKVLYTISGSLTFFVYDVEEASKYTLGRDYDLSVEPTVVKAEKKPTTLSSATSNVKIDKVEQ